MTEQRLLFGAMIAASLLLHLNLVRLQPNGRSNRRLPEPTFIEIAELPPLPPPAPVHAEEPAPQPTLRAAARATPTPSPTSPRVPAAPDPAPDRPVDFTSTVLSSADGPGVAVPLAVAAAASRAVQPARRSTVTSLKKPDLVPVSQLARAPRAPALDSTLEKNYPAAARRSGISGSAVVRVRILADGRVGAVRPVSESYSGFGKACERTLRSARWEPPIDRDGKRVATEITYTCRFETRS